MSKGLVLVVLALILFIFNSFFVSAANTCDPLEQYYNYQGSVLASDNSYTLDTKEKCEGWCEGRTEKCKSCWWSSYNYACVCGSDSRMSSTIPEFYAGNCIPPTTTIPCSSSTCDNSDCTTGKTCSGANTATITEMGDDYSCSPTCVKTGTKTCGGPWTCQGAVGTPGAKECTTQSCGGVTYKCYDDNNAWKWRDSPPNEVCSYIYGSLRDHDCDGASGCSDTDCQTQALCPCSTGQCTPTVGAGETQVASGNRYCANNYICVSCNTGFTWDGSNCVDTTPPTVSVLIDKNLAKPTDTVIITATASDSSGVISEINIYVDYNTKKSCPPFATTSPYTCVYSSTYAEKSNYRVSADAKDNAVPIKNYKSTEDQFFTIDGTAPSITSIGYSPKPAYAGQSVTLTATASDTGTGVNQMLVGIYSTRGDTLASKTCSATSCSVSWTPSLEGTYTGGASATDNAGNPSAVSSISINVQSGCSSSNCGACTSTQCTASINCKWTGSSCVSCVKSGSCTGVTICDGYWCSSGQVCDNGKVYRDGACRNPTTCSPTCPPYSLNCIPTAYCGAGQACCSVTYGTATTDCVGIGTY